MSELISNGDFATDTIWSKGTGWTISGGQGVAAATAANQFLAQTVSVVKGGVYVVSYDVANYASGDVRPSFDSGDNGTARNANGSYTDTITLTGAATSLRFGRSTADYTGRIDNVRLQGLSATLDETGLANAASALINALAASPEALARAVVQAYANGGVGSTVQIALNEAALAAAASVLIKAGDFPNVTRKVRAAIQAYLSTLAI